MKTFTKFAFGALALVGAATAITAPASAQPYGYGYVSPRTAICDPYSRWYDPFRCDRNYYGNGYYGGPVISFGFGGFGGGWRDNDRGRDFRGGNDFHGGNRGGNTGGHTGGMTGGGHHH